MASSSSRDNDFVHIPSLDNANDSTIDDYINKVEKNTTIHYDYKTAEGKTLLKDFRLKATAYYKKFYENEDGKLKLEYLKFYPICHCKSTKRFFFKDVSHMRLEGVDYKLVSYYSYAYTSSKTKNQNKKGTTKILENSEVDNENTSDDDSISLWSNDDNTKLEIKY